jgi:hypothetical protein
VVSSFAGQANFHVRDDRRKDSAQLVGFLFQFELADLRSVRQWRKPDLSQTRPANCTEDC